MCSGRGLGSGRAGRGWEGLGLEHEKELRVPEKTERHEFRNSEFYRQFRRVLIGAYPP